MKRNDMNECVKHIVALNENLKQNFFYFTEDIYLQELITRHDY